MPTTLRPCQPDQMFVLLGLQDRRALGQLASHENDLGHNPNRKTFYAGSGNRQWPTGLHRPLGGHRTQVERRGSDRWTYVGTRDTEPMKPTPYLLHCLSCSSPWPMRH